MKHSHRCLVLVFWFGVFGLVAGCVTYGSVSSKSFVIADEVNPPRFVASEIAPYLPRIYEELAARGLRVEPTTDSRAASLQVSFNPNPFHTVITITLLHDDVPIATASASNNGWGTLAARQAALGNLAESAAHSFGKQLHTAHLTIVKSETPNSVVNSCFDAISTDPDLQILKDKVGLSSVAEQTFAMLTNNAKPTEAERVAILAWGKRRDECIRRYRVALDRQKVPLAITNVINAAANLTQFLVADLYNGKITYAELARRRQELTNVANDSLAKIQVELQKQTAEARAAASQLALQAQQNMLLARQATNQTLMIQQQQQMITKQSLQHTAPSRTVTTNCRWIGDSMWCDSN